VQGTIIEVKSGQVPPKQYLERVYKSFSSLIASATAVNDGTPELVCGWNDALPDFEGFMKDLEANKNDHAIYAFYALKDKLPEETEPPYPFITDENNNTLVVGVIEGDYKQEVLADIAEFLIKTYEKTCSGDLKKFEDELDDKTTKATLENFCDHRGALVLYTITGRAFWFEKHNPAGQDFPWGRVSNRLDFVEQSSKDVSTEQKALSNRFLNMIRKNKQVAENPPVIADTKAVTSIAKENAKTATAVKPPYLINPPDDLVKKRDWKKLNAWYDENTDAASIGLTKEQMMAGADAPANDKWLAKNAGKYQKLAEAGKELREKLEKVNPKYKRFAPIITQKTRHILNELLESDKVKAITGAQVLNPDDLKNGPKTAPWSAQMGRDLIEVLRWDDDVIDWFVSRCIQEKDTVPIRLLITELSTELTKFMVEEPTHTTTDTKIEEDQPVAPETPLDDKPVDPPPAPPPVSGGKKPNPFDKFKKKAA